MIPAATLSLLVPFFFASWWIEYAVAGRIVPGVDRRTLLVGVRSANLVSYSMLAMAVVVLFVVNRYRQ